MTTDATTWSNQIAERINCYGLADWLRQLAAWLNTTPHGLIPVAPVDRLEIDLPERGLHLIFNHPHAGNTAIADFDRWVLEQAIFYPSAALPFGLDAQVETSASAQAKLGDDSAGGSPRNIAAGDRRISCFLDDARVVELSFGPQMTGLTRVWLVRLGRAQLFDERML